MFDSNLIIIPYFKLHLSDRQWWIKRKNSWPNSGKHIFLSHVFPYTNIILNQCHIHIRFIYEYGLWRMTIFIKAMKICLCVIITLSKRIWDRFLSYNQQVLYASMNNTNLPANHSENMEVSKFKISLLTWSTSYIYITIHSSDLVSYFFVNCLPDIKGKLMEAFIVAVTNIAVKNPAIFLRQPHLLSTFCYVVQSYFGLKRHLAPIDLYIYSDFGKVTLQFLCCNMTQ